MRPPEKLVQVIGGKRYSVETSTLVAGNDYWDGHNFERSGTNCFLYRTKKGNYFSVGLSQWEGAKSPSLEPLTLKEARDLYEILRDKRVSFEEAFPIVKVEEA